MTTVESRLGLEPRRADFALSYLMDSRLLRPEDLRRPRRIGYDEIARVHSRELIERLHEAQALADIFGVHVDDVHVDEALRMVRLACGGTLAAAREALRESLPTLNLLGGFHHAGKTRGAALCPINDVAIAIAALRHDGLQDTIAVIDLDAHPPDGTAECLADDPHCWIGSISGSDWGPLPGVDETVLPPGTRDGTYLVAVGDLLRRMPEAELTFVLAGGDVLEGDRLGALGLSLEGARQRDRMVAEHLAGRPQVWLPAGGYSKKAWRVLAGSALAIMGTESTIPAQYDSVHSVYSRIADSLSLRDLAGGEDPILDDLMADLGTAPRVPRLLGFYTESGVEYALERYGILDHLRRLGYDDFRVELSQPDERGRFRLFARARGVEHLVVECVLERKVIGEAPLLYVHWLTLQDSARRLSRSPLPGQEHPGLGLARESAELLGQVALRIGLEGVAFTPSWCHMAYLARERAQFVDAARQGRFEALFRDLGHLPAGDLSKAVSQGRVLMNGEPYQWEATDMVAYKDGPRLSEEAIAAERDAVRFTLKPAHDEGAMDAAPKPASGWG